MRKRRSDKTSDTSYDGATAIPAPAANAVTMSGSISTTGCFSLIDGARYDYIYASGRRASATVVMRTGGTMMTYINPAIQPYAW